MLVEKRRAHADAAALLSSGGSLRHVALELRLCLEAVVYEKLWAHRKRLPLAVARKWQPPQAFKAFIQVEPDGGRSKSVSIALEQEPGVPAGPARHVGTDHRPDSRWLSKVYNKLGALVHAPSPFSDKSPESAERIEVFLREVLEALRPFVASGFTSTLAQVVSLNCCCCDSVVTANAEGARRNREMVCLNPECEVRYVLVGEEEDGTLQWKANVPDAPCVSCGASIEIVQAKLSSGSLVTCSSCSAEHEVFVDWRIRLRQPSTRPENESA